MYMRKLILYRDPGIGEWEEELQCIERHFPYSTNSRVDIQPGDLVIGRYSVLPFYEEQERDIQKIGAKLINTYEQHQYIAKLANWYKKIKHRHL